MNDVEKATGAILAAYGELHEYAKEDALQIIGTIYQCDRPQAAEFIGAIELVIYHAMEYPSDFKHIDFFNHFQLKEGSKISHARRRIK